MPEIIELSAHCTIEMEDALNVGGDKPKNKRKIYPPIRKPAQENEEVNSDGTIVQ